VVGVVYLEGIHDFHSVKVWFFAGC
jgi:hypothetical protein